MANVLASGTADNVSSDIVVASGATATVSLIYTNPAQPPTSATGIIKQKGSDGSYYEIPNGRLTIHNSPRVLDGPGTYQVARVSSQNICGQAFGVDAN